MAEKFSFVSFKERPEDEKIQSSVQTENSAQPFWTSIEIEAPVIGGLNANGEWSAVNQVLATAIDLNNNAESSVEFAKDLILGRGDRSPTNSRDMSRNVAKKAVGTIGLPMPNELPVTDINTWNEDNDFVGDIIVGAGSAAVGSLAGLGGGGNLAGNLVKAFAAKNILDATNKYMQKGQGIKISPRKEMYYGGQAFREFAFSWDLYPKSAKESKAFQDMANMIRKNSYPERLSGTSTKIGFEVWQLPSTFYIKFMHGDGLNPWIPKFKPLIVSSVTTNFASDGWHGYQDGSPTHLQLSIVCREIEVLTQKDVDEGF